MQSLQHDPQTSCRASVGASPPLAPSPSSIYYYLLFLLFPSKVTEVGHLAYNL